MQPSLLVPLLLFSHHLADRELRFLQITDLVMQLRSPNQLTRTDSKQKLMRMEVDDLPLLKQVLRKSKDISAAQFDPLHDVVIHIYLRNALLSFPREEGAMLGISLGFPVMINNYIATDRNEYSFGIPLTTRPGQVANEYLENDDIILAAGRDTRLTPTPSSNILIDVIRANQSGDRVTLFIQRGPVRLNVAIPLGPRFLDMGNDDFKSSYNRATLEAENYWNKHFSMLVRESDL